MKTVKAILIKNKKIITYLVCSGCAAVLEGGILLILRRVITSGINIGALLIPSILIANTLATFVSAVFHYIVTSVFVFKVKKNVSSIAVYLITFFAGLGIQNGVLWVTFEHIFNAAIVNEDLRTVVCKVISLATSFFLIYFLRNALNSRLLKNQADKTEGE